MTDQHDQAADEQLCVIGHRKHRAHDGKLVCTHHAQEIATWLRDVEDQAALLDPRKSMAVATGGKGGSLASQQAPLRLDAVVLTDRRRNSGRLTLDDHDALGLDDTPEVFDVLTTWAETVRGERNLSRLTLDVVLGRRPNVLGPLCPASPGCRHVSCDAVRRAGEPTEVDTIPAPATVTRERRLLTKQLPWILEQPWVADLHDDLRDLVQALRRSNGTLLISAGRCETIRNGEECGGRIFDVAIHHPDGPDEPGFRCDRCREVWLGTAAIRKRDQLARQTDGRMGA